MPSDNLVFFRPMTHVNTSNWSVSLQITIGYVIVFPSLKVTNGLQRLVAVYINPLYVRSFNSK
jgi:hypothetical protein